MLRLLNHHFNNVYQYAQLVFGTSGLQIREPSDDDVQRISAIQALLKARQDGATDDKLSETQRVLKDCISLDALLCVTDEDGWNILQRAVINEDMELLKILVAEGFDLNTAKCSLPLHVAAFLGNLEMVKLLISKGADPAVERGMCFPGFHHPVKHVPSRFHFLETDIYTCDSERYLAVMYAIQRDHVHIVRYFFDYANKLNMNWLQNLFIQKKILHFCCKKGAFLCLNFLVDHLNCEIDSYDDEGLTPIHYAVRWGQSFVECLVNASANVHAISWNNHETVLHRLFSDIQDPAELLGTTIFLLGVGMEQKIAILDKNGNSVLHAAVSLLNRSLNSFPSVNDRYTQMEYDDAVVQVLEILLQNNCDVSLINSSSITALHKLLLIFDFVISNEPAGITLETLPIRENYCVNMKVLYRALEVVLKFGASSNLATGAGRTPLLILLQSALNSEVNNMCRLAEDFCACLELMCKYGAKPSLTTATHVSIVSLISKLGFKCLSLPDGDIKEQAVSFVCRVLAIMLNNGLDCNHHSSFRKREVDGRSGNVLVELVRLTQRIRRPHDLVHIRRWVLTALQWGADPDMEPYPSEPIICHSQSSIFLRAKSTQPVHQYMYEIQDFSAIFEGGHAENFLMLFYCAMGHVPLYQCLSSAKHMSRFDADRSPSRPFVDMVTALSSQPRSLKQIARVAIYEAIDRKLAKRVPYLPLPTPLKRYILNVE